MWLYNAQLVLEDGIAAGALEITDGFITAVHLGDLSPTPEPSIDCKGYYLSPGFVDIQFNGALGVDFSNASLSEADVGRVQSWLPSTGVTSFLPTVISSSLATYASVITTFRALCGGHPQPGGGARVLGLHLEGPFMAPGRKGAHCEAHLGAPGPGTPAQALQALLARCTLTPQDLDARLLRVVTLAPEVEGGLAAMAGLAARGVVPAMGHTGCDFQGGVAGLESGAQLITHLFNAMAPFSHREPGLVGLLGLPNPPFFSLIADGGVHLHPAALALAFKAAPHRAVLVTDAMASTGLPPGEYSYGDLGVTVWEGGSGGRQGSGNYPSKHVVLTGSTTLAGSVATMDVCLATLAMAVNGRGEDEGGGGGGEGGRTGTRTRTPLHLLFATLTSNPLAALRANGEGRGLEGLGALRVGFRADLTLVSQDWKVAKTWVGGTLAFSNTDL